MVPGGLVDVRVSWSGHPRYLKKIKKNKNKINGWYMIIGQVHGAFAGYSGITVGICNSHYVYLPIPEVISSPRAVDPDSRMWHRCLTSTGQPDFT